MGKELGECAADEGGKDNGLWVLVGSTGMILCTVL